MISFVAALGGLLFGYDWVVVGGAKPFYEPYFNLTSQEMIGWANSCALLGCLLGLACSGVLMDRYGRKKLLLASALIFTVSSIGTGWAGTFDTFVFWQWSGTNVIFNYAEEIYRSAGYDLSGVMFNIVITGVINLVFTLVATAFVDRAGRRAQMLWGTAG